MSRRGPFPATTLTTAPAAYRAFLFRCYRQADILTAAWHMLSTGEIYREQVPAIVSQRDAANPDLAAR